MNNISEITKNLLENQTVNLVIGFKEEPNGNPKPFFVTIPDLTKKFIYNEKCTQNLIAYLHKSEIKAYQKIAVFVNFSGLRALMQLIAENQLNNLTIIPIILNDENNFQVLEGKKSIENYITANYSKQQKEGNERIEELQQKSLDDRWDFWVDTLKDCIKCYACRSACPMCYCGKCTTDCNQPQWVSSSSHTLGNLEWHIMRAMHLAGRCVNCDECFRACPLDLPINLLTRKLNLDIEMQFGQTAGLTSDSNYVLSTYKFEDKENFIR